MEFHWYWELFNNLISPLLFLLIKIASKIQPENPGPMGDYSNKRPLEDAGEPSGTGPSCDLLILCMITCMLEWAQQ